MHFKSYKMIIKEEISFEFHINNNLYLKMEFS